MSDLVSTERVHARAGGSASLGQIRWDPVKSIWYSAHVVLGVAGVAAATSWGAFAAFLVLTSVTICAGHSVGMHRLLIHRSFETPRWLERTLVWLGTLVGMAGPFGMIRAHDMRDWHQRQSVCPPHPSHGAGFWRDSWWQLHCRYDLDDPPDFVIERVAAEDAFYVFLERTWMAQQLVPAIPLYLLGGWGWVLWGVSLRIAFSLTGHLAVGHYAHRSGHQGWRIEGLPVQGYNVAVPGLAVVTFGENWHGNHHAFPHSARLGVDAGQLDPGFLLIAALSRLGLAHRVRGPLSEPPRAGLVRVGTGKGDPHPGPSSSTPSADICA